MLNYTTSEENYIKAIYHLQKVDGMVTTNELAAELESKPASITDMMKKLKAKKLLNYQPYQGFRLTADGTKVALGIIRRHRLWEFFLAEKDIWKVVKLIVKERKKRELEPMLQLLDKLEEVEGDKRDKNIKSFLETVGNIKKLGKQADKTLDTMIKAEENWFINSLMKMFK